MNLPPLFKIFFTYVCIFFSIMVYHRVSNIVPSVIYSRNLFIHSLYTSLHLQIPNSQSTPLPSCLPLGILSLFSLSEVYFCFVDYFICVIFYLNFFLICFFLATLGERNGKPVQYSCLENPMNSMKRQKDMTQEDEPPRSVGVRYATRERVKRLGQSRNDAQL